MKRFVVFICAIALVACGHSDQSPVKNRRIVRTALPTNPISLDPRMGGNRISQVVIRMLFEGLTRITPEGNAEPAMAKSIDISNDGLTYTFHLRNTQWSNGDPVTAEDFVQSWRKVCSPNFDSRFAYAFYNIKNAEEAKMGKVPPEQLGVWATDEQTLVVELKNPAPYFLDHLANPICCPVNHLVDQQNPTWCNSGSSFVCNGMFNLVRWVHDSEVVLDRNPLYWDASSVQLDGASIAIVDDSSTAFAMFEKGELDWLGEPFSALPIDVIPKLKDNGELRVQTINGTFQYFINCTRFPLTSKKIRQSLAFAINRDEIVTNLLKGNEKIATSMIPPMISTTNKPLLDDGDYESAAKLFEEGLAELGISRSDFPKITISYSNLEGHKTVAQAIQQHWKRTLDINVELEEGEWTVFFDQVANLDYSVACMPWYSWLDDPIYNLESLKYAFQRLNVTGWEDPKYIELLDLSDRELNTEQRNEYLRQAEELVMDAMPIIPLHQIDYNHVKSDELSGVFISKKGMIDFKYACLADGG